MNQETIDRLDLLISRYERKAERALATYQEIGDSRHYNQYSNAEELAGYLRLARYNAEDHAELVALKGIICHFATQFSNVTDGDYSGLVTDFLAYATGQGLIQNMTMPADGRREQNESRA